jgi:hypothetical protein
MTAIRAEELDLFVAKFLIVAVEFALALWAGHPKYFSHDSPQRRKSEIRISKSETNQAK